MKLSLNIVALLIVLASSMSNAGEGAKLQILSTRPEAPDFSLPDTKEKIHTLSEYRGTPVIVIFWATWCKPCREEMPSLQRAWEYLRDHGVMVLAINIGDRKEWIPKFRKKMPVELDFTILLNKDSTELKKWGLKGLPSGLIVDADGRIAYRAIGALEWDEPSVLETVLALITDENKVKTMLHHHHRDIAFR